jgi:hypothetical protein
MYEIILTETHNADTFSPEFSFDNLLLKKKLKVHNFQEFILFLFNYFKQNRKCHILRFTNSFLMFNKEKKLPHHLEII